MTQFNQTSVSINIRINGKSLVKEIRIDDESAKCFLPLPKSHDLAFDFFSQREAAIQREKRDALASVIASKLVTAIIKEIESTDPKNGYSPEEIIHFPKLHRRPSNENSADIRP